MCEAYLIQPLMVVASIFCMMNEYKHVSWIGLVSFIHPNLHKFLY
jgi:hypothetical protein